MATWHYITAKRLTTLILWMVVPVTILKGQQKQLTYLGEVMWQSNPHQQQKQPLPVTATTVRAYSSLYKDSVQTIKQVSIDPGTITLHYGRTVPIMEKVAFTGTKLLPPEMIRAAPLQTRDNAMFNVSYTDKQHGYAAATALDFAEDEKHNIWIASEKGPIRYDGYHYYLYTKPESFREMAEMSLAYDNEKRLWSVSENGVYFIRNDSLFTIKSRNIDFSSIACKKVYVDALQRVWIATKNNGAICITGTNMEIFDKRCGLPANYIETIFVDSRNNLLLSCRESGIVMIEPGRMRMFLSRNRNMEHHIITSFSENEDGIWAGSFMGGLFRMGLKDTVRYSFNGKFNESIYDLKKAPGGIWISCYGRFAGYLNRNGLLIINEQSGLLNRMVYRFFTDSYQNVWIGNPASGFSRINENNFYLQHPSNTGPGNIIKIIPDGKGGNWIISNGNGLVYKKDRLATCYNGRLPSGEIWLNFPQDAVLNDDGTLWTGTYGEGITKFNGKGFINYRYSGFTDHGIIRAIKEDAQKNIWFCPAKFGLIVYDDNKFWQYTMASGLLSNDVYNLFSDAKKNIYWGFSSGLQRLGKSGIETFYIGNTQFKEQVNDMLPSDTSAILLATKNNGLLLIRNNKVYQFNSNQGILSNEIKKMIRDKSGHTWISTAKSIESFILDGTRITDHLVFNESNGNYIPDAETALLDTAGIPYWMIGEKKLVYNPVFAKNKKVVPIFFTQVSVDGRTVAANEKISTLPNQKITVDYQTIYWGRENNLKMKYQLISNQKNTTERPVQENGSILLSDVIPGSYSVVLKAIDNNDIYYSTPISITVRNFWYNTLVFRICLGALIVSIIIFYFRQKAKRQLLINEVLKRKVREQTEMIEKEKDALFISYKTIDLQNKEKDVLIEEINHRVKNNLQFISAMLEMQLDKQVSRDIIQALLGTSRRIKAMSLVHELLYSRDEQKGLSMQTYIHELVANLSEMAIDDSNRVNIEMEVDNLVMDSKTALSLGMIISELVSNSFKHAFRDIREPEVRIQLKKDNDTGFCHLIVSDNGKGYQQAVGFSNGVGSNLVDIFSRQLEGTYIIQSSGGFIYTLTFKIIET